MDDILLPRLGRTYFDEFRTLSALNPNAAGFIYNRYNTQLKASVSLEEFSIAESIREARIFEEWEDGKYVVNTDQVETVKNLGLSPRENASDLV